ncbi:MAG: hypothetical protein WBC91_14830, partial [Phototrophicaceae bacterium]
PLGCGTGMSASIESSNVQRRAANLALRGFIVAVTNGLCNNGILGEDEDNHYTYASYAVVSDNDATIGSYQNLIWLRLLDYLETRNDVDISRVGVTGYSNGGGISQQLFDLDSRISAAAIVATRFVLPTEERQPDPYFISRWYLASLPQYPQNFMYSTNSSFNYSDISQLYQPVLRPVFFEDISRPQLYVLATEDDSNSLTIGEVQAWIERVTPYAIALGYEDSLPSLVLVDGDHNYNSERRSIATNWLADVLDAQAILEPSVTDYEHQTPIFEATTLEPIPDNWGQTSIRTLFVQNALDRISNERAARPFPVDDEEQAQIILRELLQLPAPQASFPNRSIQTKQTGFILNNQAIDVQRWLVSLPYEIPLYADLTILQAFDNESSGIVLFIAQDNQPLPSELLLSEWLAQDYTVFVLTSPSFEPIDWSQTKRGHLAQISQNYYYTLLGLGVSSVQSSLELSDALNLPSNIILYADGVESSVIAMFATAMNANIQYAILENSVASFQDFLTAPTAPIIPPVLYIEDIFTILDISDLQALASNNRIRIESYSDLSEYRPDF